LSYAFGPGRAFDAHRARWRSLGGERPEDLHDLARTPTCYLAARTDPDSTRHRGISVFCLPLNSPGVTMTLMWNLGGGRQNHTYLDGVRVPAENMLGVEG
jgi:alkylation response protein AidB-like acyl-CoA dehydrogenase